VTDLSVAFAGVMVDVWGCVAPPASRLRVAGVTDTHVVATAAATTVTTVVALKLPTEAVMVAEPTDTGVTTPADTVATAVSLLDQVTDLSVAFAGVTVAVRVPVSPPATRLRVAGLTETAVTATVEGFESVGLWQPAAARSPTSVKTSGTGM